MTDLPLSLRLWRSFRSLTREAVAEAIGTTVARVEHWETGRSMPTEIDLGLLAGIGFVPAQEAAA